MGKHSLQSSDDHFPFHVLSRHVVMRALLQKKARKRNDSEFSTSMTIRTLTMELMSRSRARVMLGLVDGSASIRLGDGGSCSCRELV